MPMGQGYFIDLTNYEIIPIQEHYTAVKESPERYRLQESDLIEDGKPIDREALLTKVLKKGFARIRHHKAGSDDFSYEAYGKDADVYAGLLMYAQKKKIPPYTHVNVFNLRTNNFEENSVKNIVDRTLGDIRLGGNDFGIRLMAAFSRLNDDNSEAQRYAESLLFKDIKMTKKDNIERK